MNWPKFNRFEQQVLDALARQAGKQELALRAQLATAHGLDRDFTGCGYYLNFSVPPSTHKLSPEKGPLGDVRFELEGVPDGGCALLWVQGGLLTCLEVCLYGDGPWPVEPQVTSLETLDK